MFLNAGIISTIVGIFIGIGALAVGIGFAYSQIKLGNGKAKDDLIDTLQKSLQAEKERAEDLQEQINTMRQDIGKLQGLHEANEKKIDEYRSILQGRSPEQKQFMELMVRTAKRSEKYMQDSADIFDEIKIFMGLINGELAKSNVLTKEIKQSGKAVENKIMKGGDK